MSILRARSLLASGITALQFDAVRSQQSIHDQIMLTSQNRSKHVASNTKTSVHKLNFESHATYRCLPILHLMRLRILLILFDNLFYVVHRIRCHRSCRVVLYSVEARNERRQRFCKLPGSSGESPWNLASCAAALPSPTVATLDARYAVG